MAVDGGRRAKETMGEVPLAALTHSAATAARGLVVLAASAAVMSVAAA